MFREKIQDYFKEYEKKRDQSRRVVEEIMVMEDRARAKYEGAAGHIINDIVLPRLSDLSAHFKNAGVQGGAGRGQSSASLEFAHCERFPCSATVEFAVVALHDYQDLEIRERVSIIPIFLPVPAADALQQAVDNCNWTSVAQWVEDRLIAFLDSYMPVEYHRIYQDGRFVSDPVCGMKFAARDAADKIECDGVTIYFCSHACRHAFERSEPHRESGH